MPGAVKAKTISDGSKTAYILDSIKLEANRLVLYNSLNENFRDEVELPATATAVSEPVIGIYNVDEYMDSEYEADCGGLVNSLIAEAFGNGGGVVKFGGGVYNISSITLFPKVRIEGCGIGSTVLRRVPNSNIDETEKDNFRNCKGFINIPESSYGNSISDLSISGGSTYTANGNKPCNVVYSDSIPANGIFVYDTNINALTEAGNPADSYEGITSSTVDLDVGGNKTQKFLDITNVSIFGMYGSGIHIGTYCSDVHINNVHISHCRYDGIVNNGTYNCISNATLFANGMCGIYDAGSYNKYNNIQIDSCGRYGHTTSAGAMLTDVYGCTLNNVIVRLCYSGGYIVTGTAVTMDNCISDSNGSASSKDASISTDRLNPTDVPHLLIGGDRHIINLNVTNSRKNTAAPVASYVVYTQPRATLNKSILNIVADDAHTSANDSNINGVIVNTISQNVLITGDTIINYIP